MTIYSKSVNAGSDESTATSVSVSYWLQDGKITFTINGTTCSFSTYIGSDYKLQIEETIAVLKEAVAAL
jgi:hypothetical protein